MRPIESACSEWIDFEKEKPDPDETVLMWYIKYGYEVKKGPLIKKDGPSHLVRCQKLRDCILYKPDYWAKIKVPATINTRE